jgi:hypothetical protein
MRKDDPFPIALEYLSASAVLIDATTPSQASRWLTEGAARGHRVIHGYEFTRGQLAAMAQFFKLSERLIAAIAEVRSSFEAPADQHHRQPKGGHRVGTQDQQFHGGLLGQLAYKQGAH